MRSIVPSELLTILPPSSPDEPGLDGLRFDAEIAERLLEIVRMKHALVRQQAEDRQLRSPDDSAPFRLARRLAQQGNPVGWFLSQVWDRFRDRAFYLSQQAGRNVREQADAVLYLVNASEAPEDAGYLAPEMAVLDWIGKPVIVLLNQLGVPRDAALEQAEVQRWHEHLLPFEFVSHVLPLDAFARCWVQELVLLQALEQALQGERRALMQRLGAAWVTQRLEVYRAAVDALTQSMARLAGARVELAERGVLRGGLRKLGAALGLGADERK